MLLLFLFLLQLILEAEHGLITTRVPFAGEQLFLNPRYIVPEDKHTMMAFEVDFIQPYLKYHLNARKIHLFGMY